MHHEFQKLTTTVRLVRPAGFTGAPPSRLRSATSGAGLPTMLPCVSDCPRTTDTTNNVPSAITKIATAVVTHRTLLMGLPPPALHRLPCERCGGLSPDTHLFARRF